MGGEGWPQATTARASLFLVGDEMNQTQVDVTYTASSGTFTMPEIPAGEQILFLSFDFPSTEWTNHITIVVE